VESWANSNGDIYCTVDVKWKERKTTVAIWKVDKTGNTIETNYIDFFLGEDVIF